MMTAFIVGGGVACAAAVVFLLKKYAGAKAASIDRLKLFRDVAKVKIISDPALNAYSLYLITKFDTTASCQFEASRRMNKKNMASTISVVILSLYAILFSLMPSFAAGTPTHINKPLLNMIAIFMSVGIIAFTLYELLKRYDLRSVLFLKSARKLQELRDEVLAVHLGENHDLSKYAHFDRQYHKILTDTDDNHSHLDYDVVRVGKGEIVGLRAFEVTLLRLINVWIVPALALLAPAIILGLYGVLEGGLQLFNGEPPDAKNAAWLFN